MCTSRKRTVTMCPSIKRAVTTCPLEGGLLLRVLQLRGLLPHVLQWSFVTMCPSRKSSTLSFSTEGAVFLLDPQVGAVFV